MKRFIIICIIFFAISSKSFTQVPFGAMYPGDRFLFDLFTDIWQNLPGDIDPSIINRGVNIAMFHDWPLGNSNLSFALGIGFTGHNLYSDYRYTQVEAERYFSFVPMDQTNLDGTELAEKQYDIRKNKISLNYLNLPLELRYRSRDIQHPFRFSLGLRPGVLVNAHTKFHIDFEDDTWPSRLMYKQHRLGNIETLMLGATARIGYGRVNLFGHYPLTNIFDGNPVESARPITVGVTFFIY
jgi:hypothetical protein